jgi:peptidoglycan/xylan/chitin deacetylase (PgdA/CDA1 family)
MRLDFDLRANRLGMRLPAGLLRALLRVSLGTRNLALMFHRVRLTHPGDVNSALSIGEGDLDATLNFLLAAFPGRTGRWLSVTFDDGYADAVAYVESRAHRYPAIDFILFVCPEKIEQGAAFRWDLAEALRQTGEGPRRIAEVFQAPQDVDTENAREDLRRVAADPQFRLATAEGLRALSEIPNVSIGNHTNCHFELSKLPPDQARLELERSRVSFERLFGRQRHFAFPFGHGFFDDSHIRLLRAAGDSVLWGTGQSTYVPTRRAIGALLPRVGIDGPSEPRGAIAVIAARSLATRVLGERPVARRGKRRARELDAR